MTAAWTGRQASCLTLLVMGALLAAGALFHHAQERRVRRDVARDLETIADLKVQMIGAWRAQRLRDASVLAEDPAVVEATRTCAIDRAQADYLRVRLETVKERYGYADVALVDTSGSVFVSVPGGFRGIHPALREAMEVSRTGQPAIADLHLDEGDSLPHIAAVAPLFAPGGRGEPLAFVVLVSLARDFLFPLVQSWPVRTKTAETLLVRRDGGEVLFLNELRHRSGAALRLRAPLDNGDMPAVRAIQNDAGVLDGRDYRGVKVIAATRRIPDSPWYLVAKVDIAEAFGPWMLPSMLIIALSAGGAAAGLGGYVLWERSLKAMYRARYMAELARNAAERRLEVTLRSVGDAVISTDRHGNVERMNPVAEQLTAWSLAEARGRPLEDVFTIVNEETRQPAENPVTRVMREGIVVGLGNHTLLIDRQGFARPIADSGAPIRADDGSVDGVVLVFRDQTHERAVRKALEHSEARYRLLAETTRDIILLHDLEGRILYVNEAGLRIAGLTKEEAVGEPIQRFLTPESATQAAERRQCRVSGERGPLVYEAEIMDRAGARVPVEAVSSVVELESGHEAVMVVARDISDRRRAEEERAAALSTARQRSAETSALLHAAQAVLGASDFLDAARAVFEQCKLLTGAQAGYVALLSADGAENDVLFLDSGGLPCTVDPSLPMPIRGLREVAYREKRPVYENDFAGSAWAAFMPAGHVELRNVLFAPLVIDGEALGLLGLANRPEPFDDRHARMAGAFGEIASLALKNARALDAQRRAEADLRAALAEKEVLLKEVHHRVKNNLQAVISLVELHREELPEEARGCLDELREQARTMALVYEQLYQSSDLANIAMQPYLEAMTAHVVQAFARGRQIAASVEAPLTLPVGAAMPCGLIVNELVTNALKHAFGPDSGGQIRVRLRADDGEAVLEVEDDGAGIDPSVDLENPSTMGLVLVRLWAVHQLGGTLHLRHAPGTAFTIRFRR